MKSVKQWIRFGSIGLLVAAWVTASTPSMAQEPECDDAPPADAPVPAGGPFTCPNPLSLLCDLGMQVTIAPTGEYSSDDLRIGDPVGTSGAERPRILFDATGNRFYAKLYARFNNLGAIPALVDAPVQVTFFYKPTSDPTDIAGPWTPISGNAPHTAGGAYTMNIPPAVSASGALYPGPPNGPSHVQTKAVCWHQTPGALFPLQFMLRAELSWGADENATNDVAYSFYDLTEAKQPADIGLVLDLSGSMSLTMPSGVSRLAVAQDRAREFVDLIEDGDRLGVYGFATSNPANSNFFETYRDATNTLRWGTFSDTSQIFAPVELANAGQRLAARAAISAQSAHGCTPVGQGLLRAKDGFALGNARARSIVLLSDGLQNVTPFVNTGPLYDCGGSGSAPAIDAQNTFDPAGDANDVRIFSIFFGDAVGYGYNLMTEIKNQTGGDFVFGATNGLELASVYYAVRNLLDDLLYLEEDGQTAGLGPGAPFSVYFDAAATNATLGIAWPLEAKARLTLERRRQGTADWQSFEDPVVLDTAVTLLRNNDAHRVYRFTPGPDTTWEFRVVQLAPRTGNVDYSLAVYSNVESARLEGELGAQRFTAGDDLPIYAHLRRAGHPIPNAQVAATVRLPARSFSTTLRRYSGRFDTNGATGGGDAGAIPAMTAQLRGFLRADDESEELYPVRTVTVTLMDDGQGADAQAGDGIYSGVLAGSETQIAGDVQVTVRANGTTPAGFAFERITKLGTVAAVGPADPDRSQIRVVTGRPAEDGSRIATVQILPTDRLGNAAFPGSGANISVVPRPGTGTLAGAIVDNLDSTFSQTVLIPPGQDPAVSVSVGGVEIGEIGPKDPTKPGKPDTPDTPSYRREASLHLGIAKPHGLLGAVTDDGPTVSLDWAVRLDRNFAARFDLGQSRFDLSAGNDVEMTHLVPYLQYRRPGGTWVPYFEAGPGYYDLENAGSAAGFSAGVGAHRPLSGRWRLDFSLHGHRAAGSLDLGYSTLRVGFLFTY